MLAVIAELGNVNLSLRSLVKDEEELERLADLEDPMSDPDPERGETFTFASEVSNVLSGPVVASESSEPKPAPAIKPVAVPKPKTVNVTRGAETSVLKF